MVKMLNDWVTDGTIEWLERNLVVMVDKQGGSAKGYGRAKDLRKCQYLKH